MGIFSGDENYCSHTDWYTIWYQLTREEIVKLLKFIDDGDIDKVKKELKRMDKESHY